MSTKTKTQSKHKSKCCKERNQRKQTRRDELKNKIKLNTHYLHNCDDNIIPNVGAWTMREETKFLTAVKERGANIYWGLLSQHVPTRTGSQCLKKWEKWIQQGTIKDTNYVKTGKTKSGKQKYKLQDFHHIPKNENHMHSRFVRFAFTHVPSWQEQTCFQETTFRHPMRPPTAWIKKFIHDRGDDVAKAEACNEKEEEPIVLDADPLTKQEMRYPMMCPSGYVLDSTTWLKTLAKDGLCPYTRQILSCDKLTPITKQNLEIFKKRFKNL